MAQHQAGTELIAFRSLVGAHQYRDLYALFCRYVPAGARVLDWGVGNGHFSYYLVRHGYQATGFSLTACTLPVWFPGEAYRLVQGDPRDPVHLPFPDQSFTAVASVGVLEHVRETGGDELSSLREIRRVLLPGGWFVCYHLPNHYSAVEAVARWVPHKYYHRYRFTRRQVRRLLQEAELELIDTHRYGFLPRNIWQRAPHWLRNAPLMARLWDACDTLCATVLAPVCQNHALVARRPAAP
jgi:SAM-dependent methyltransferase